MIKTESKLDAPIRRRLFSCAPCLKKKKSCCGQAPNCARCKDNCSFDADDIAAAKAHRYSSTASTTATSSPRSLRQTATTEPKTTPKSTISKPNKPKQSEQLATSTKPTNSKPEAQHNYSMRKRARAQFEEDLGESGSGSESEPDPETETEGVMQGSEEQSLSRQDVESPNASDTDTDDRAFEGFSPPARRTDKPVKKIKFAHDMMEQWSTCSSEYDSDEAEILAAIGNPQKRKRSAMKKRRIEGRDLAPKKMTQNKFDKERVRISDDEEDYVNLPIEYVEPTADEELAREVTRAQAKARYEQRKKAKEAPAKNRAGNASSETNTATEEGHSDDSGDDSSDNSDSDSTSYWDTDSDSNSDEEYSLEEMEQAEKMLKAAEDLGTGFKLTVPQAETAEEIIPVLDQEQYEAIVLQRATEAKSKQEARAMRYRQLMRTINAMSKEEIAAVRDVTVRRLIKKYYKGPFSKTLLPIAKKIAKQIRGEDPQMDDNAVYTELLHRWEMCWNLYITFYMDEKRIAELLTAKNNWTAKDKVEYLRREYEIIRKPVREFDAIQFLFCYACVSMHAWDEDPDLTLARWCYLKYIIQHWAWFVDIVDWRKGYDEDLKGTSKWLIEEVSKRKYNDNRLMHVQDRNGGQKLVIRRWFLKELNMTPLFAIQQGKMGGGVEEREDEELLRVNEVREGGGKELTALN